MGDACMNINIRKLIYKVPFIYKLCINYVQYMNDRYYERLKLSGRCIDRLNLKNKYENSRRCFIVGNGPSLTVEDLDKLIDEDCFASNLIFKIFDNTKWRPKFYFIQDRYARTGNFLNETNIENVFVGNYFWRTRTFSNKNAYCFKTIRVTGENIDFSYNPVLGVYDSYTITYTMIQFAVYMGYKEIYLLGIDHNYPYTLDDEGNIIKNSMEKGHFFLDENDREVIANIRMMEKGYLKAKEVSEQLEVKIYNATRGGKLEIFERLDLKDVL